jgi:predicted permease
MQAHISLHADQLIGRGVPAGAARRIARLRFGNPRAKREEVDEMNRLPMIETLWRDARFAVRLLRRTPAFSLTAIVTLALVIGANTAVFSLADAILVRPLPYPHPERLAAVVTTTRSTKGQGTDDSQDGATWEAVRDQAKAVDVALTASDFGHDVNLVVKGSAVSVGQQRVSAGYFRVLGVAPLAGHEFTADEDRPGGPAVAVLSYSLWQRLFNGNSAAIGQTILLRGEAYEVVGVMPAAFRNPGDSADVWTPARPSKTGEGAGTNYGVIARVRAGYTWEQANGELASIGAAFFKARGLRPGVTRWLALTSMQDSVVADMRDLIEMLCAAVGMVLLIACVNLAALLLARGGGRTKEIATRMALGSGRVAVVRQLMVESTLLGLTGGALGLLVGYLGLESLKTLGGETFEAWTRVTLDGRAIAATAGFSLLTSLLFGLVPAWQASRFDINASLAAGGSRTIAGGSRHWGRRALVASEVALGVVLLVVTGLLTRTFTNLQRLDPGFDPSNLTTVSVSLQDARYATADRINQLFDASLAELDRTAGIEAAAVSLELPYRRLLNSGFKFADRPVDPDNQGIANFMYITPRFFETFRIPIRQGRAFSAADRADAPPVAIVNETFVRVWAKGVSPIGRRLGSGGIAREIVGVVGDQQVRNSGVSLKGKANGPLTTNPLIFLPAAQTNTGFFQMVHTWFTPVWSVRASSSVNVEQALQRAIGRADPLLPLGRIRSMATVQAAATSPWRLLMILVGVLSLAALLLSAIGIHGLIAHSVAERTREFGIRLALGATAGQTVRSVALSGVTLAATGAVVGIGLAWVAVRLVESGSFLVGVTPHDPATYMGVAAFFLVVATISSVIPALRILRIDPARTLRE